jgi:hypothetical protein
MQSTAKAKSNPFSSLNKSIIEIPIYNKKGRFEMQ